MQADPPVTEFVTTGIMGVSALMGALSKGYQWVDSKTGKFSWGMMASGLATAVFLAEIANAAGMYYGISIELRIAGAGIIGYIGPAGVMGFITGVMQKWVSKNDGNIPPPPP